MHRGPQTMCNATPTPSCLRGSLGLGIALGKVWIPFITVLDTGKWMQVMVLKSLTVLRIGGGTIDNGEGYCGHQWGESIG